MNWIQGTTVSHLMNGDNLVGMTVRNAQGVNAYSLSASNDAGTTPKVIGRFPDLESAQKAVEDSVNAIAKIH